MSQSPTSRATKRPSFNKAADAYAAGNSIGRIADGDKGLSLSVKEAGIAVKYQTINEIIENPISCGYLLLFCTTQFNSENLNFLLAVDKYRDNLLPDSSTWASTWREVDVNVGINEEVISPKYLADPDWTGFVDPNASKTYIDHIVQQYLTDDSPIQICIAATVYKRTLKRISLLHLYGPDVFEEACIDPIKTMTKDILPRFIASEIFTKMIVNLVSVDPPPPATGLKVPPPDSHILSESAATDFPDFRRFDLEEIMKCLDLYNEFLKYLRDRVCSENLICVRMIRIFEEYMTDEQYRDASRQAWKVYQYFVAPGAAYEVSIHYLHRKDVMLCMAKPKLEMFDQIKRSAMAMLRTNFDDYKNTPNYAGLSKFMREKKEELERARISSEKLTANSPLSCFGAGSGGGGGNSNKK